MGGNPNYAHNNRPRLGNIVNRVFESAGPDGKVRGTPQQIIDKYQALARDAQLAGDRVAAESFLQHAEHYSRMLGEAQPQGEFRQPFEREDGSREEGAREDGSREDGRREDAPRAESPPDQPRPRGDGQPTQPRPRDEGRPQHPPQRRPEPQPVVQPVFASSLTTIDPQDDGDFGGLIDTPESAADAAPYRDEPAPILNGAANGVAHAAVEALPPEEAPRAAPKRGRPRRKAPRPEGEQADAAPVE